MIIESASLAGIEPLAAHFCVIGSGMGGATLAQRLAKAGKDVLLVEAGSREPTGDSSPVQLEFVGRSFNAPSTRCIELGGTSNQWHGICAPLDDVDFEERDWVPGSGWPITRDELNAYYAEASRMHEVPADHYATESLPESFKRRLRDITFDDSVLSRKLVYARRPPMRWKGALEQLAQEGKLRLLLNAPALELVLDAQCRRVQELIVGAGAETRRIRAHMFIVCCGALETPRLLLNSRGHSERGIGNERGLVGRNLLDHPAGHFSKIRFHKSTTAPLFAACSFDNSANLTVAVMASAQQQRLSKIGNHYLWIRPAVTAKRIDDDLLLSFLSVRGIADLTPRQIWGIITNRDLQFRILVQKFGKSPKYRYGDLYITTEQLPNPNSRVKLSATRRDRYGYPIAAVDWQLSTEDFAGFDRYIDVLFGKGLKSDAHELARMDSLEVWDRNLASTAHHMGTARMGSDPSKGVVDRNLNVFAHDNLFVCDGSVFPTGGSANPSLTISALAIRLANHLQAHYS